jgi:hypothetical protein
MKRKSLIISAMIAALGIGLLESGPANAQGLGGGPGMMQGPGAGRRAVVLPGFNTDGVITPIGLQQARQQFAQRGQGTGQGRGRGGQGQGCRWPGSGSMWPRNRSRSGRRSTRPRDGSRSGRRSTRPRDGSRSGRRSTRRRDGSRSRRRSRRTGSESEHESRPTIGKPSGTTAAADWGWRDGIRGRFSGGSKIYEKRGTCGANRFARFLAVDLSSNSSLPRYRRGGVRQWVMRIRTVCIADGENSGPLHGARAPSAEGLRLGQG